MKGEGQVWTSGHLGLTPAGSMVQNQDHVLGEEENRQLAPGIGLPQAAASTQGLNHPGRRRREQAPQRSREAGDTGTQLSQHINIVLVIPGLFLLWGSEYSIKLSISN